MIDRKANRTYTPEQRAEAIGLALVVGPLEAGKQLGISHRTVSSWVAGERRKAELSPLVAVSREQLAEKLAGTLNLAVDAVLSGLRDPKSRLSDRAHALDVLARHHALLTGGVTERTESETTVIEDGGLTFEQRLQLAAFLDEALASHPDAVSVGDVLADALAELNPPALPPGDPADSQEEPS